MFALQESGIASNYGKMLLRVPKTLLKITPWRISCKGYLVLGSCKSPLLSVGKTGFFNNILTFSVMKPLTACPTWGKNPQGDSPDRFGIVLILRQVSGLA